MKRSWFSVFFFLSYLILFVNSGIASSIPHIVKEPGEVFSVKSEIVSREDTIHLTEIKTRYLTLLCQLWGFLKYHHPEAAKGTLEMDAQLFKILPPVMKAQDDKTFNSILESWVDQFGVVPECNSCQTKPGKNVVRKPDYAELFDNDVFNASLTTKLNHILTNRIIVKHHYVKSTAVGNAVFTNELSWDEHAYPDLSHRVLSLFRYWNTVQYFYPYKHLIGASWSDILRENLPRFIQASDQTQYALATLTLVCSLNDTHANIGSGNQVLEKFRGMRMVPFQAKFVEGKLTVTAYYSDTLAIKDHVLPGDIITGINEESVDGLIRKYLPITSGSNEASKLRNMPRYYLLRSNDPVLSLEINRDGRTIRKDVSTVSLESLDTSIDYNFHPEVQSYKLLTDKIGYIYSGNFKIADLPQLKSKLGSTTGLIIDIRCSPLNSMAFSLAPYVKTGPSEFVKLVTVNVNQPGLFTLENSRTFRNLGKYKGKVVILVNEITQSFAEFNAMSFQGSPNVSVVGSTTAGADGNVSKIVLPGGITTYISGLGMVYPDGSETQRKGIKIDHFVAPTIDGVKAGIDEALEKAIQIIGES